MPRPKKLTGIIPDGSVYANAAIIFPARTAELLEFEKHIYNPENVVELHDMRIAAKRLRYTLEIFGPFYTESFPEFLTTFKALQDHLGFMHDADILVPELAAAMKDKISLRGKRQLDVGVHLWDFDGAAGILSICRKKRDEREARYVQFMEMWARLRRERFFERLLAVVEHKAALERAQMAAEEANSIAKRLSELQQ